MLLLHVIFQFRMIRLPNMTCANYLICWKWKKTTIFGFRAHGVTLLIYATANGTRVNSISSISVTDSHSVQSKQRVVDQEIQAWKSIYYRFNWVWVCFYGQEWLAGRNLSQFFHCNVLVLLKFISKINVIINCSSWINIAFWWKHEEWYDILDLIVSFIYSSFYFSINFLFELHQNCNSSSTGTKFVLKIQLKHSKSFF